MTSDLQAQQAALRAASEDAESRRQFIETVLSGVSAGVIGLDADGPHLGRQPPGRGAARPAASDRHAASRWPRSRRNSPTWSPQAGRGGEAEDEVDVVRGRETRRLRVRASRAPRAAWC